MNKNAAANAGIVAQRVTPFVALSCCFRAFGCGEIETRETQCEFRNEYWNK
jgi:hypothetical protein